ncbi:hypothetical protein MtrunA17_Chr1g0210701 [Medicago truncatula]|uniref:Uncharacterized protein n=1 Tax=Medicago truncatula TaxID=3880 RepID=A0A396JWG3_MEDTR|nr:hypothetical protein MtrunA17_Chr1g0210701 [Medicago truncatula]
MSDMKYRCRQQHPFLESKNVHHCVCMCVCSDQIRVSTVFKPP